MATTLPLSPLPITQPKLPSISTLYSPHRYTSLLKIPPICRQSISASVIVSFRRPDFRVWADDGDGDSADPDDYDMDEEEVEELDNKKDFDVDYDTGPGGVLIGDGVNDEISLIQSKSFISTQGWDSEKIVEYKINEEEFHKICLLDCDFFIRKPPDPDGDVYDFREMYVTPPDTDIYVIPRVLASMPQKYIRCAKSDYGCYNVTEPPIDAPRDPMYKSEREVLKNAHQYEDGSMNLFGYIWPHKHYLHQVFLTKHYRNRRSDDPEFMLDFEEIYVIDSKSKSITRAKVLVTVHEGKDRDRKKDLLVIRDKGNSFKIIPSVERDDPTTVIEKEEWNRTRQDMERHLRKLRDFSVSNWF